MKNDIIGTFAILILGMVFLFFARNYDSGQYWMLSNDLVKIDSIMKNNESQNLNSSNSGELKIQTDQVKKETLKMASNMEKESEETITEIPETKPTDIKPEKNSPPISYLLSQMYKSKKQNEKIFSLVGGKFSWPAKTVKDQGQDYQYIVDAQGLKIEGNFDITGVRQNRIRKDITKALRKVGFKQVYKNMKSCQTEEKFIYNQCLDYYQRGNEKCVTWITISNTGLSQTKIWCGKLDNL